MLAGRTLCMSLSVSERSAINVRIEEREREVIANIAIVVFMRPINRVWCSWHPKNAYGTPIARNCPSCKSTKVQVVTLTPARLENVTVLPICSTHNAVCMVRVEEREVFKLCHILGEKRRTRAVHEGDGKDNVLRACPTSSQEGALTQEDRQEGRQR